MLGNLDELATVNGRVEDVYEVGHELGKGAFSVVKHGRHRQTGQNVALKIIPAAVFKGNKRAQEAIRAEVEAMRRIRGQLDNPSLIVMLEVFSEPTKVSIVLEELNGGELFDRIVARGRYTEKDASQLICTLATALSQCHEKGILHRDVKPENIMYTSRDESAGIKLTDFGLALLYPGASTLLRDDNLVGTPGYVAPEVLSSRLYGPPCDVWSCGVLMYILLAGYPPFFATGEETLFEVIKQGKYYFHTDAWDQISSEAKDLVYKMLTVDTEKRATLTDVLNHPWVVESCNHDNDDYVHLSDTIHRLKAFNAKRKWRAVAAVVMLGARLGLKKRNRSASEEEREEHGFSVLELETLKGAFLSSAEGGVLSRTQLASVFSDVGFGPVPSDRMFDLFDKDGNGTVDYKEFLEGMSSFKRSGDKALRFCFDIYDKDGVGCINLEQLKSVLSCVTRRQSLHGSGDVKTSPSEDELTELFKKLDVDGNGTIDFDEFKAGAKNEPLLVRAFLAPVQQGSLATAPAAVRKTKSGEGSGPGAASREASGTSETPAQDQNEGQTISTNVSASSNDSSSRSPGTALAAAEAAPEKLGSWSEVPAPKYGGEGCDDGVDGRDELRSKRSRVEGLDAEEGR
eukprot:g11352.t1